MSPFHCPLSLLYSSPLSPPINLSSTLQSLGIIMTAVADLDRETQDRYELVVKATDMAGQMGGLSGSTTVTIVITDVNDNPPRFPQSECLLHILRQRKRWWGNGREKGGRESVKELKTKVRIKRGRKNDEESESWVREAEMIKYTLRSLLPAGCCLHQATAASAITLNGLHAAWENHLISIYWPIKPLAHNKVVYQIWRIDALHSAFDPSFKARLKRGLNRYGWLLPRWNVMDLWLWVGFWAKWFSVHTWATGRV